MDERVTEAIIHYQTNLDKYFQENNENKMVHCLSRLERLPMTVAHLEKTGIGRTVNSMRKMNGLVGECAKQLVNKWKAIVTEEEEEEESEKKDLEDREMEDKEMEEKDLEEMELEKKKLEEKLRRKKHKSKHSTSHKHREKHNNRFRDTKEGKKSGRHAHREAEVEEEDDNDDNNDNNDEESVREEEETIKSDEEDDIGEIIRENDNNYDLNDVLIKTKKKKSHKERYERSRNQSDDEKSHKSSSERNKSVVTSKNAVDQSNSSRNKSENSHKSSSKHNENKRKSTVELQSVGETKKKRVSLEESIGCESGASFAEALGMTCPTTSHKSSNSSSCRKEKKDRDRKHSKSSKSEHRSSAPSSSSKSTSLKSTSSKSTTSLKSQLKSPQMKSTSSSSKTTSSSKSTTSSPKKSILNNGNSKSERKFEESIIVQPPKPTEPIDINLSSLLPQISTNYKPLGLATTSLDYGARSKLLGKFNNKDDADLTRLMYAKTSRTKVYSGNKSFFGKVPSLFELCTRVLQDNIDALEYTGGVPYSILKPVLDRATPEQLFTLEHYNPYLMDESDELWFLHCQKLFKRQERQELESWRDMYLRCLDEREAKLKALTANIKLSQDKAVPVRQTKLAYVDSIAKPPRNVARKQGKNGVDVITPSNKLSSIATANISGQVAVPNPVSGRASAPSSGNTKPKKAPLMQKTLQLMKGRFRR